MKSAPCFAVIAAVLVLASPSPHAHAAERSVQVAITNSEFALMPSEMDVTLLNDGGKFVTVDMKTLPKGEKCHMEKEALLMKVKVEDDGAIRVRRAAPNLNHGGCPFTTEFDLSAVDYTAARAAFTAKSDEASKNLDDLKKQLGDKWDELTGQKSEQK